MKNWFSCLFCLYYCISNRAPVFHERMTTTCWMFFSSVPHLTNVSKSLFQLSPPSFIFFTIDFFVFAFSPCAHPFHSLYRLLCVRSLSLSCSRCFCSFLRTALNSFAKWIAMHRMCGIFNSKSIWSFVCTISALCYWYMYNAASRLKICSLAAAALAVVAAAIYRHRYINCIFCQENDMEISLRDAAAMWFVCLCVVDDWEMGFFLSHCTFLLSSSIHRLTVSIACLPACHTIRKNCKILDCVFFF